MPVSRSALAAAVVVAAVGWGNAQVPAPPPSPPPGAASAVPAAPPPATAQPRGRRVPVQVMTLTSPAWPDGGRIPEKYTQAGAEVSPPLSWSGVPDGVTSFVLVAHDLDAAVGDGTSDVLHWLLWNIPGSARSLPEGIEAVAQRSDGTRQISQTGPFYRGPGAAASGPPHHYVFELFALDGTIDVPAVGQSPADTRAAVMAAMAGRVRGKAAYVGLFKR